MKKMRILAIFLVLALVMTGCCLKHEWVEADCVNPKTCAKCEKTEGEALGHTWTEATCTAPKTCSVCAATEGEALGHVGGYWTANTETMTATCVNCSESLEEPVDWEVVGWQEIVDLWEITAMKTTGDWEIVSYTDVWVEFREDRTATFCLIDPIECTVTYAGYEADAEDIVFELEDADGDTFTFYLWYENDSLFIFGSGLSFAFERA